MTKMSILGWVKRDEILSYNRTTVQLALAADSSSSRNNTSEYMTENNQNGQCVKRRS